MGEGAGEGAELVADQPRLKRAHPGGVDQRLGQMLVHLAVPFGEQRQRALAQRSGRAFGRGLAGEPQIRADQRQERARGEGHGVELRLDEALAGMDLARSASAAASAGCAGCRPSRG
jgi:hypothetical protein